MARLTQNVDFNEDFCARTKQARERRGYNQIEMAEALGIVADTYSKYERRTPLPHRLIPRFCLICGIQLEELFAVRRAPRLVRKAYTVQTA